VKIFIDGEPFNPSSPEVSGSKEQLLAEIDEEILQKGLTYTTIVVDGVEMDSSAFVRLRSGREAHIKTRQTIHLVIESLQEAMNYLPRLNDGIQKLASELEHNNQENLNEHLADFAEGLGWLVNVMQKSQIFLDVKDSQLSDKVEVLSKLNKSLQNIFECLEKHRIMEIAFHMRQGILPEIKKISEFIEKLLEAAKIKK